MTTIDQDVQTIRQGIYGKDVREAIADGIEKTEAIVANIQTSYSGVPARVSALENSVIKKTEQSLSSAEKDQARTNIGAQASGSYVQYTAQTLSDAQKAQARTNIGAQASGSYVQYTSQSLTDSQKAQARDNIDVLRDITGINVAIDVNTSSHSATISGGRLATNSGSFTISSGARLDNLPQDSTTRWLVADLNIALKTCSFRIVNASSVTFGNTLAWVGYVYNDVIATVPGIHVFNNGEYYHWAWDTWTEFGQNVVGGNALSGPERMLIVDLHKNIVTVPNSIIIVTGSKTITTIGQTIDISGIEDNHLRIAYDSFSDSFIASADALNRNRYMIVAEISRSSNYVYSIMPYILITNSSNYYDVSPEVVVYGDSIVAGAGGIGFENIVAAKAGIRMLNRGIGSTGYLTHVNINTTHLTGNDKPAAGTQQVIDYADNNITERLTADIGNITQNVIAIMAGTNDVATSKPLTDIIGAVETCINMILNAGKVPVIISPIRRENVNLTPFYTALKEKCFELGVSFIDVYSIGINPGVEANKNKYIPDGIHPSNAGYNLLAAAIADGMKRICMVDKYY